MISKLKQLLVRKNYQNSNDLAYANGNSYARTADMTTWLQDGYSRNAVIHRCINLIASEVAKVPLTILNERNEEIQNINDDLFKLLTNPNLKQSKVEFFTAVMINYLVYGNSYIRANYESKEENTIPQNKLPILLDCLNPLLIKIKDNCFEYGTGHNAIKYPIGLDGSSNILHIKSFSNSALGISTITALEDQINQINLSNEWNNNVLKNSGNVSAVLEMDSETNLTPKQVADLKKAMQHYKGSRSLSMMTLPRGIKFNKTGLTPTDLNWVSGIEQASKTIAFTFGVPVDLLMGQATYENLDKAKEQLWDNAVKPHLEHILTELNKWLTPRYNERYKISYDEDSVEAIASKRDRKRQSLETSTFMTINEKREAMGLDPLEGADTLLTEMSKIPLDQVGMGMNFDDELPDSEKDYEKQLIQKGYDKKSAKVQAELVYDSEQ